MRVGPVSRRQALAVPGGAGALAAGRLLLTHGSTAGHPASSGYAPDGLAGRTAFPLSAVRLLDSPFRANQSRNTAYPLFLDPERMLRSFRINYGLPASAQPCGGWEAPDSEVRGHTTGHLCPASPGSAA